MLLHTATSIDSTTVVLSLYACTFILHKYMADWISWCMSKTEDTSGNEEKYIHYSVFIFHCKFYWFGLGLIVSNYSIVFEFVFFLYLVQCVVVSLIIVIQSINISKGTAVHMPGLSVVHMYVYCMLYVCCLALLVIDWLNTCSSIEIGRERAVSLIVIIKGNEWIEYYIAVWNAVWMFIDITISPQLFVPRSSSDLWIRFSQ